MSTKQLLIELEKAKVNNNEALVYEIEQILDARV
jgi:hypothetical protein